jgi:hypothetical protein
MNVANTSLDNYEKNSIKNIFGFLKKNGLRGKPKLLAKDEDGPG